jgi:alpha-2-macroglobulin-like protein
MADLADDYVHRLLDADRAREVERHCDACPACKTALEDARRRLATLRDAPAAEASEELVHKTMRKIDAHQLTRKRRWRRFVWITSGALAASLLLLAGLHAYNYNLSATPYDLVVLGQNELLASTNGSLRVVLRDAKTMLPVAGVPVTVQLFDRLNNKTAELARFTTDAHGGGQPRFTSPDWADASYELRIVAQTAGTPEIASQHVTLKRSFKVMLSTDKPVYQPGQVIHARSLALRRPNLHPVAEQAATFTVADPKGNVVFKQDSKTSRYGITAADCPLDTEIQEGAYTIQCKTGDVESRLSVDVKKYVLPKFKVVVTPDRAFYKPGDTIKLAVQADYFFGKPVADASVKVDAKDDTPGGVAGVLEGRTDAKGAASFDFVIQPPLIAGQKAPPSDVVAHVHFQATVVDPAGQKQSASAEPAVSNWSSRIEVIPESGDLVQGVSNKVYVLVTRLDGRPAERVHVILTNIATKNADKADADENGTASFEIVPSAQMTAGGAQISFEVSAQDDKGELIARRGIAIPCGPVNDFLLRTDKAVYRGGDTMSLTALGGPGAVFVDFIKEGQTLLTETIEMVNGQGEAQVDLPADMTGTVQVVGYRLDAKGYPVRRSRVVYVQPADQIHIAATLDPGKQAYKPGDRPTLRLKLSDKDGKPCPGAVSLAGVDEAVFSVLAQRPGMEQAFYTLEQDLMAPVYKIHSWSSNEAISPRFERALFAAASRTDLSYQGQGGSPIPMAPPIGGIDAPVSEIRLDPVTPTPEGRTHTLMAQTYQPKVQAMTMLRQQRLDLMKWGWVLLVIALIGAALAAFWIFGQASILVKSLVTGYVVLPFLLFLVAVLSVEHYSPLAVSASAKQTASTAWGKRVAEDMPAGMAPLAPPDDGNEMVAVTKLIYRGAGGVPQPRIREMFPETLLWKPEIITDDDGTATLPLELADSITTWRLSASAVAGDGKLGAMQMPVKVFQDFFVDLNLPVALTRGDEVGVPVVVYNYLDKPQTVTLTLADDREHWFRRLDGAEQRLDLKPNEVRSVRYRLKVEKVVNGTLEKPVDISLVLPEGHIPGSAKAFVKIYPSSFSQLVEGLDGIFRMPSGCFEQTSSSTYPNVLALDYLKRTGRSAPAVRAKAEGFIHYGYQRLLGFEIPGGGFDWFGNPPANRALTAYGLMEFTDMAKVHDVDPVMIERTRRWLLSQRRPDGSWNPEEHKMHEDAVGGQTPDDARLAETAYIGWAVFSDPAASSQASPTLAYLKQRTPETIKDPHTLALVCNALLAADEHNADVVPYLDRLEAVKHFSPDGKFAWWEQAPGVRTTFYGAGRGGSVETTALAALALIRSGRNPDTVRKALTWLTAQKDASGTWYSTQATVLALKALLAGTGKALDGDHERNIEVRLDGLVVETIKIPADQSDVLKQVDLSPYLKPGKQVLTLSETSGAGIGFQSSFRFNEPEAAPAAGNGPLSIDLTYDRTQLSVGEQVLATATVVNKAAAAPMVMVELPVPAGFVPSVDDFAALVKPGGKTAKYQIGPRSVLLYLTGLEAKESLTVKYHLRATMPVKAAVVGARVYEYYDPDKQGSSLRTRFTVAPRD